MIKDIIINNKITIYYLVNNYVEKTDNSNDFIDDCSDIHQDSSNSVKQKFILRYKPSEQKESLSEIQPDLNKQIVQKDSSINCVCMDYYL